MRRRGAHANTRKKLKLAEGITWERTSHGFAKGGIDSLKGIDTGVPFIFDEVNMHLPRFNPDDSREITCVEGGGTVTARNTDVEIPPGVPRIFTSNMEFPFKNPGEAVYGRRVIMHHRGV